MKRVILVCFWFFVLHSAFGQVKKIDTGSDTGYNDTYSFVKIKKAKLIDLKKSGFKNHYRFSKIGQIVDIWTKDELRYYGTLLNYIYKYPASMKLSSRVLKKELIDTVKAREIVSLFNLLKIKNIPSQNKIPKWEIGKDGDTFEVEYSTPDIYSYKSYWEPAEQQSIEGITINKFSMYLKEALDLKNRYEAFRQTLPDGRYTLGISVMIKATYWKKMNPKGGTSLFN
jgi:hypothetical protein